ncbi:hypothetical protein AVEN_122487-1 [Araneus ventricosus]|uniref:Uncharacterized protein n=1 Tax=Araneus ventricosus TaxID=182803 RepID=A0A4Y1ZPR8_ARAVE|nr:hypothetical protein AVEN_122487-1 [Araneus ventricosus]
MRRFAGETGAASLGNDETSATRSGYTTLPLFHEMKKGEGNGKSPCTEKILKQPIQPRLVQNISNRIALTKKNLEAPG